ncbi:NrfD/PsrC family molybdoenzyme membrane anchor subunit [Microbulbifer rhizosphaerae]|uniref:Molybdopterin-containing oxidoreductase family membrane subunit n=1 Tax=Microbulbifer rhizosphaerae TaxID=1562603 RepID=A0A7W4WA77_9GAMM|nr:NrfD/PsrC family molybdoenzyme membrane anchor subunit [Microbulbifer rhizosphaerae]MBB3060500.1 molybdopterin-containing oxidoreductase family membrane subunit [Microbulbifer rhizosphaerae]
MPQTTPETLLPEGLTHTTMTERIAGLVLEPRARGRWRLAFAVSAALALMFVVCLGTVFTVGVGLFGVNIPVAWGFPIVNTIWWIGIAHAGTLISAVLLLTRQPWRAPVARLAEAMALFAIVCAGIYAIVHLGRPQFMQFLIPYPNTMDLWPQWRSPLVWDFFAISTYFVFTLGFLYFSLLPDFATLRDRAHSRGLQIFYGVMALGWRGSALHWARYEQVNRVLAAVAAPIVVSVTGIISLDLAVSLVPGFHFTIFPPYFVAGALFSGFATVSFLAVVTRAMFGLKDLITRRHLDYLGRMMLLFALVVNYAYIQEVFTAWYSGDPYQRAVYINRWTGPYAPAWWAMFVCNSLLVQLLWFRRVRRSPAMLLALAITSNIGMWLERFQIVFTSTYASYMPSAWGLSGPTLWDLLVALGSLGLFAFLLLAFVRLAPVVSMHDMRVSIYRAVHKEKSGD